MYITLDTYDFWIKEIEYIIRTADNNEDAALEILTFLANEGAFEVIKDEEE